MKKMFKVLTVFVCVFATCTAFAEPPHWGGGHGHGRHGGPPRHHGGWHHRYHGGYYGNDGVWLAAGITNIIANGLGIVRTVTTPPAYVTQPVCTTPVVQTPVYTQPVYRYDVPAVQPVYTTPVYYPPRQVIRNIPIYDAWGNIHGYRQVITYEK